MQKIRTLTSLAALVVTILDFTVLPLAAQQAVEKPIPITECLAVKVNFDRLVCYDNHFGYAPELIVRNETGESVIAEHIIDRRIAQGLKSRATLGGGVAVYFENREEPAKSLDNEAALTDVFRSRASLETLQKTADLHLAVNSVEESPETGVLYIGCIRDITEFWLRWRSPFLEEISEVWIYENDNVNESAFRTHIEFEYGEHVMGFPRGLPSIDLLRDLASRTGDRFAIEAGSERKLLVFEREALLGMLRAQRLYCSWR